MDPAALLLLILPALQAQIPHWGPCPDPPVQSSFSLEKYLGKWYEIARLPAQFEKGRCMEAEYSLRVDGTIKVYHSEILKGELRSIEGTAVVLDQDEPAKLGVSFSYVTPYTPYWILSTDYHSSALVYSCTDVLRLFHLDLAWVLGRNRTLPPQTLLHARDAFTAAGIDVSRMIATRQDDCDICAHS